jgi:hypothetical protein
MRSTWRFDHTQDYGLATSAVREIVALWLRIDWFAPPGLDDIERSLRAFADHVARTRAFAPNAYADPVRVSSERGGWDDFVSRYARVTHPQGTFDWRWGMLKPLLVDHRKRHGFSLNASTPGVVHLRDVKPDAPQPLYATVEAHGVLCMGPGLGVSPAELFQATPTAALHDAKRCTAVAASYTSYASQDASFAIEWQLAAPDAPLTQNPFVPLLEVYDAGAYPLVLSAGEVVLFSFTPTGGARGR